ncbi:MAG: PKD domain-containing protein [Bacteroidales bacterium]|nr:PKD domain-containing protein [Bacteroidales bacterium]
MFLRGLKKALGIFIFLGIYIIALAQGNDAESILKERGEVYFRFHYSTPKEISLYSKIISIDKLDLEDVYAYANKKEFSEFLGTGKSYEILQAPGLAVNPKMKDKIDLKSPNDWDYYPTYEGYLDLMYQFEANFPDLCEIVSIGQSVENRELLFAHITDDLGNYQGDAQFMYTGTIHGDETTGFIVLLRLIDYMLNNYGTDPRITEMVQNLDIWINPAANPDGTYAGGNNSVYGATRYNANGIDMNRNYPDPEDGPHPDGNQWQPETIAFMQFAEEHHFVLSANTHGGTEVCNYPWDTWPDLHADDDWWQYVCHEYADTAQYYSPSGYMDEYNDGITNGYQWYTVNGGRQDYMNYFHQCREFTLEMSNAKLLPANQLPALWEYNYRSLLNYMEQTTFGISGTVTDANTGNPLKAQVFIESHDEDSSMVFSDPVFGKFYRPVYEGSYDITFTAPGYYSQTIENVAAENRELTILNVELGSGNLIADFVASITDIPVGATVDFTDLTFGNPTSWEWTFEGGTPSTSNLQNPQDVLYPTTGTFDVSLTVSDGTNFQTIVKEDYINVSLNYVMQNTTVTTCEGNFYDSGGPYGNYSDDEDFTMIFLPGENGSKVKAEFFSFSVEDESSCEYDWLKIFDGAGTNSGLVGTYCGTDSLGTIVATNEQGALTFQFHSDYSVTASGWAAYISCESVVLPPAAEFTADITTIDEGGSVMFTDLSTNEPTSWEWSFEGGTPEISYNQNPEVTYMTEGVYSVSLTVTNAAGSNSITKEDYITVNHITGIDENIQRQVNIYPNPARNEISFSSPINIQKVTILNMVGKRVYQDELNDSKGNLDISSLENGIYFLRLETNDGMINKKLQILK